MFINFSDQYLLICVLYNFWWGHVWMETNRMAAQHAGRVVNQLCHLTLNQHALIIKIFSFSMERNFKNIHVNNFKWRHLKLSSVDSDKIKSRLPSNRLLNFTLPITTSFRFVYLFVLRFHFRSLLDERANEKKNLMKWNRSVMNLAGGHSIVLLFAFFVFGFMGSMMINTSVALKMFYKAWFPDMQFQAARARFSVVTHRRRCEVEKSILLKLFRLSKWVRCKISPTNMFNIVQQ